MRPAPARGSVSQFGEPGRPPAPLAGDDLVGSARHRAHDHRLQHAPGVGSSRPARRSPPRRSGCAAVWDWATISSGRELAQLGLALAGFGHRARIAARPRPIPPRGRSATGRRPPRPARSRPRRRRSGGRSGSRAGRSSAPRRPARCAGSRCRRRGSGNGCAPRLSTSCASLVRPSSMVSSIPAMVRRGVELALHERQRVEQTGQPLQREVLGLDRDDHPVGRDQGVDGQRAQRGRAVEQHERDTRPGSAIERVAQAVLGAGYPRQLDGWPPARSGPAGHDRRAARCRSGGRRRPAATSPTQRRRRRSDG